MLNEKSFIKELDALMHKIIFYDVGDEPATEKQFLDILNRYEKEIKEIPGFVHQAVHVPVFVGLKVAEKFKTGDYTILDAARYIKSDKDLAQLVEQMKHPEKDIVNVISEKLVALVNKSTRFEMSEPAVQQFMLNREVVSQEYHGVLKKEVEEIKNKQQKDSLRIVRHFNFPPKEDGPSVENLTAFALYTAYTNPKELKNVMGAGMDSSYRLTGVSNRVENLVVEHFTTGKGRFLFFTPNEKGNENSLADILAEQSVQRNIEKFVAIASVLTPEQLSKGIEKMPEKTKAQIAACLKRQKDSNSI